MPLPDLDLNRTFFCHSHSPTFGLLGELRTMARQDMTLLEAARHHAQETFKFKSFDDALTIPYEAHDMHHILLAISSIYAAPLNKLLPEGYNSTFHSEYFTEIIDTAVTYLANEADFSVPNDSLAKEIYDQFDEAPLFFSSAAIELEKDLLIISKAIR